MPALRSEDDFLALLDRFFPNRHPALALGRGDDAALLKPAGWCVTVDGLVENVHFRPETPMRELGWKAFMANASDLNAMGARAAAGFLSLSVPYEFPRRKLTELLRGLADGFAWSGAVLAGGDLSRAGELQIHLTLLGKAPKAPLRRDTARAGDALLLVGQCGLAEAGLRLLERRRKDGRAPRVGGAAAIRAHRAPAPPLAAGPALAALALAFARRGVRDGRIAALDLSDGPARDALRFSDRGRPLGAVLDADAFPISDELRGAARALRADPRALALSGGEDYALLVACPEPLMAAVSRAAGKERVHLVGWLSAKPGLRITGMNRDTVRAFDHFTR